MKKSHSGFWVGITVFFIAAVYSVILFLVKPNFDIAAWVLYGATMVAFLLFGIQSSASAKTGCGIIMDTTLSIVTGIYFGLQLIFGGIICMSFSNVPLIPVIVCESILLAAYLVISFLMYAAQSNSASQEHNDQKSIQEMRLLESDVQGMIEEASDPNVKKALKDLAEVIHFSDAVTLPGLAEVEGWIAQNIAALRVELTDKNADPLARIENIRRLLKERDRTAAILKR